MKISIITVSYNAVKTIEQTIRSVVEQDYADKEYIIIDGGSTDGTKEIIEKYKPYLAFYVSEPDNGMYDALVKGFNHATGDVYAYINADDFYQPHAFSTVMEVLEKRQDVKWVTGINATYNLHNQITDVVIPYKYSSDLIKKGLYNGKWLPFIQQESTFWRKELMQYIDYNYFSKLHLAGDYYLWYCFSSYANLDIISCILSGFRICKGQLSENLDAYRAEQKEFCDESNFIDILDAMVYKFKAHIPQRFMDYLIKYDFKCEKWE